MSTDTYDDDYTDAVEEELGYADFDWSELSDDEVDLHDRIVSMTKDELADLDYDALTDLQKWSAARAWAELEVEDRFLALCYDLVRSEQRHPALDYAEIGVELVNDLLIEDRLEEARDVISEVVALAPEDSTLETRFLAMVDVLEGNLDSGLERFQQLVDKASDDAHELLLLADDMIGVELLDEASKVLDAAEELAESEQDREVLGGISESREFIASLRDERDD